MTSTPPLDLDAIRDRLDAATEGPWQRSEDYSDILTPEGDHIASYFKAADGDLIAHAPEDIARLLAEVHRLRAELATARNPHTPRLCECGHSHHAHTVPAPHSCFAFGQTCPCKAYRQLPHDEAVAQLERNRQAAAERAAVLPSSA